MPLVSTGPLIGPNETHTFSTPNASGGCIITMDVFVDPSNTQRYLELASPVAKKCLAEPECIFCELSVHPDDKGHIRILHGWKRDSRWWQETHMAQEYFQIFMKEVSAMWVKPRIVEHFDRFPVE